ncbi:MAG: SirB2 family protein [Rhodoferax sp.]|nr:SirB2 family protein [Rhodoferax sp.]NCP54643.1 SirB2 family protein [Rhodoferax sp.]OIP22935.1 MAG: invasion protein [Comamonadaceae bacterium CG2_30_60_41]PJC12328.1 MAG: invasion protein [Comamonadaceae bacterium CG_4_9_14_0_8_um_filter_60_18]
MDYLQIKFVHMGAVTLSGLGFLIRAVASLQGAAWVKTRVAKTVPHVVDTMLLVTALTMLWQTDFALANLPWLQVKIVGLLAYILLGMVTLRPRYALSTRVGAFVAAVLTFSWMVSVAVTKDALGYLAWLFG